MYPWSKSALSPRVRCDHPRSSHKASTREPSLADKAFELWVLRRFITMVSIMQHFFKWCFLPDAVYRTSYSVKWNQKASRQKDRLCRERGLMEYRDSAGLLTSTIFRQIWRILVNEANLATSESMYLVVVSCFLPNARAAAALRMPLWPFQQAGRAGSASCTPRRTFGTFPIAANVSHMWEPQPSHRAE
jgi:hypothetical protein